MSETIAPPILSVSEANELVNETLSREIGQFLVEGEVAGVRVSRNTWLTFTLKDQQSTVECFSHVRKLTIPLEEGMRIKVLATPRLYVPYGKFSLSIIALEAIGEGALRRAYELLLQKLDREGLFEQSRKRPLPRFPSTIAIITSPDGAALHDVRRVLSERWGGFRLQLFPVAVQGVHAVEEILEAITYINLHPPDVVILTRGGGSLEDLQAFNSELVARAVATSRVPIIVGIGHEQDTSIAELVADKRAATPSNAAQLAVPDRETVALELLERQQRMTRLLEIRLNDYQQSIARSGLTLSRVEQSIHSLLSNSVMRVQSLGQHIARQLTVYQQAIADRTRTVTTVVSQRLSASIEQLNHQRHLITQLSPRSVLDRGYSLTILAESGQIIRDAKLVAPGTLIATQLARGTLSSEVLNAKD